MAALPARLGFTRRRHACALLRRDRAAKTTRGKIEGEDMADRMRVIVAYDGSECADAALDDLRRAGLPSGAQIKILSVVENWLPPRFESSLELAVIEFDFSYAGAECNLKAIEVALISLRITGRQLGNPACDCATDRSACAKCRNA